MNKRLSEYLRVLEKNLQWFDTIITVSIISIGSGLWYSNYSSYILLIHLMDWSNNLCLCMSFQLYL